MTNIPEDIMREAEAVFPEVRCLIDADHDDDAIEAIASALLAERLAAEKRGAERERERCSAIVADHIFDEHELAQATECGRAVDETVRLIAAAIRRGEG